jgi:hypothetical protein
MEQEQQMSGAPAAKVVPHPDTLRVAVPHDAADLCPRRGQCIYFKETLLARFGADVLMVDVRHSLLNTPERCAWRRV